MSKTFPQKKSPASAAAAAPTSAAAAIANRAKVKVAAPQEPLLFGPENFKLFGISVGLILLGMLLMMGGRMTDPNTWDPTVIYSFTRITLAPIVILAGLVVAIFAIFKTQKTSIETVAE